MASRTATQALLGLRATRGADVRVPIYAIETSFLRGQILTAARALARRAHVPARDVKLVDRSAKDAHCDPLFDDPGAQRLPRHRRAVSEANRLSRPRRRPRAPQGEAPHPDVAERAGAGAHQGGAAYVVAAPPLNDS